VGGWEVGSAYSTGEAGESPGEGRGRQTSASAERHMAGTQRPTPMSQSLRRLARPGALRRRAGCADLKSPVREIRTPGSVGGRRGNPALYPTTLVTLARSDAEARDAGRPWLSVLRRKCRSPNTKRRSSHRNRRSLHPRPPPDLPALDSRSVQGHL